jgi:hypothetical protein
MASEADEAVNFVSEVHDAVEFMRMSIDADADNRALALVDLKFRYGEQWPQYAIASRGLERPQLTINEMDSYIRQVTNSQRQQRPRMKVHPVDDYADVKTAKVISGLLRHIEVNSDADNAYDTAFDFAATMGFGYWRIDSDYIREDSFDQDIFINSINNPFSVYFDPISRLPDGSDAEKCLITDLIPKAQFKKLYAGAQFDNFGERGTGDSDPEWMTQNEIRIAEYFHVKHIKAKLVKLSDGTSMFEDELPPGRILEMAGIEIIGDRPSAKRKVMWRKQTAMEILEERELPWRWIPIVPVYWTRTKIDNRTVCQGMVRPGMDAQRMVNFWQTSVTEQLALAPKAKYMMAEGQDEGHEIEWKNANLSPTPVLRYKQTDIEGQQAPVPQRIQPEQPPAGAIQAAFQSSSNLQKVMGIYDPNMQEGPAKSGKAVLAERNQSENSNYHGFDQLTKSLKHTGRIILSGVPRIFDTKRLIREIGEDGNPMLTVINDKSQGSDEQAANRVVNDVTIGTYDIVMDTGPGYDTKRIQGVDSMMQLMQTPIGEKVATVGDDLIVRQMDFPGADVLADRLAASNPLSQIDEKSEIPPAVQIQIKAMQQQVQQLTQQLQQAEQVIKTRSDLEQMKQSAETQRKHMELTVRAHDIETRDAQIQRDVTMETHTRAHDAALDYKKALDVEEIRAHLALLLANIDKASREKAESDSTRLAIE